MATLSLEGLFIKLWGVNFLDDDDDDIIIRAIVEKQQVLRTLAPQNQHWWIFLFVFRYFRPQTSTKNHPYVYIAKINFTSDGKPQINTYIHSLFS